jgi:hypothetical protein
MKAANPTILNMDGIKLFKSMEFIIYGTQKKPVTYCSINHCNNSERWIQSGQRLAENFNFGHFTTLNWKNIHIDNFWLKNIEVTEFPTFGEMV